MNIISVLEQEQLRNDIPDFRPGDTVKVHVKVVEGNRERIQVFEGVVIGRQNGGVRETFTVRRISYGVGVERTFLVHSPRLAKIEVVRHGIVRRAKLNYLRGLTGKVPVSADTAVLQASLAGKRLSMTALFLLPLRPLWLRMRPMCVVSSEFCRSANKLESYVKEFGARFCKDVCTPLTGLGTACQICYLQLLFVRN